MGVVVLALSIKVLTLLVTEVIPFFFISPFSGLWGDYGPSALFTEVEKSLSTTSKFRLSAVRPLNLYLKSALSFQGFVSPSIYNWFQKS